MMFFSKPAGHKYVDRGDPSSYDFTLTNFTTNGQWHDLDLSGILPANTKFVQIKLSVKCVTQIVTWTFRKKGNTNYHNGFSFSTQLNNVYRYCEGILACNDNRVIEYSATNVAHHTINFLVRAWFE